MKFSEENMKFIIILMLVLVFTFVFYTLSWQVVKYGAHPHQIWDYFSYVNPKY